MPSCLTGGDDVATLRPHLSRVGDYAEPPKTHGVQRCRVGMANVSHVQPLHGQVELNVNFCTTVSEWYVMKDVESLTRTYDCWVCGWMACLESLTVL